MLDYRMFETALECMNRVMRKKSLMSLYINNILRCHSKAFVVAVMLSFVIVCPMSAQPRRADYSKLSSMVRSLVTVERIASLGTLQKTGKAASDDCRRLCAFVQTESDSVLAANGARTLARYGDICIADIPIGSIAALSLDRSVRRIEAGRGIRALTDTMAVVTDALPAYQGTKLPQAYTGEGVVMGIQDIGFDLTHPNFYTADGSRYRIKRLWDQLSADTVGSTMYVGAEYTDEAALTDYRHSRDAVIQSHGTHTLGIAAGSGYDKHYRGMAYDADICLVSNAVSDDVVFIDSADLYKYTYATDALGFKYIFDYAESQRRPCVISFSEGSDEDLRGDDVLYYEMLRRMTGPGRIIVSSAGNSGHILNYIHKSAGDESAGTYISSSLDNLTMVLQSPDDFALRIIAYGAEGRDSLTIASRKVVDSSDSTLTVTVMLGGARFVVDMTAYRSSAYPDKTAYDFYIEGPDRIGRAPSLSLEILGKESDVELFRTGATTFYSYGDSPHFRSGDNTHGINSPSAAPSVICVGATSYRKNFRNKDGKNVVVDWGAGGVRAAYSSVGPTVDGRTKPDVMAPGSNVISSIGSYWFEKKPNELEFVVDSSYFNGDKYYWSASTGTSMSSPAVGGIVALWLQANPGLTPDDVLGVISRTSNPVSGHDGSHDNLCGYGQIDAYRGLLDILGLSKIESLSDRQPCALNIYVDRGRRLRISAGEESTEEMSLRVYSVDGSLRYSSVLKSGQREWSVDLSALPDGVYAVQTDGADRALTGSTLVRLKN